MFLFILITASIFMLGLFWYFLGRHMISDKLYFLFGIMVILIMVIPVCIYMINASLIEQRVYIISNKCVYTGQVKTDWVPVIISTGNSTSTIMQKDTTYYWKCNNKIMSFDLGPK